MSSIFKTIFGVAGGIAVFKSAQSFAETINECRQIYDYHINQQNKQDPPSTFIDDSELRNDSVTALVNLGYKTNDSKKRVENAITNGNCKTVQDIIRYVLTNQK
jgi:Holliday junction resolvasome RuvABC DNA-binding subunit